MRIREVEERDFTEWLKLRYALWPYHTLEELEEDMREICKRFKFDAVAYIAEDNDDMIGFIELSIRETAPGCRTNNVGFIEGWYVKPEYRQRGVGKLLVLQGEAWAVEKGCTEMGSDTNERYPVSPIAHRALGYEEVENQFKFRKALGR